MRHRPGVWFEFEHVLAPGLPYINITFYNLIFFFGGGVVNDELLYTQGLRNKYRTSPFEIVNAGDHCERSISKQILPLLLIFG